MEIMAFFFCIFFVAFFNVLKTRAKVSTAVRERSRHVASTLAYASVGQVAAPRRRGGLVFFFFFFF